jgi:hypothetical protein
MSKSVTKYASIAMLVASVVFCGVATAAGESKLSQKPIPLQSEAYSVFAVEDITSYESLLVKLTAGAEAPETPVGRIWSFLSPSLRAKLLSQKEGEELERNVKYRMINGLNAVLRNHTLFDPEVWDTASMPEDLQADFEAGLDTLPPVEATARNRALVRMAFPDEILESQVAPFVHRPKTLRIFGDPFLGSGELGKGFKTPTGAVWQPSLFAYGTLRTAWQYEETGNRLPPITDVAGPPIDRGEAKVEELVTRLDLFFNLGLTPTERVLLHLRPFDHGGNFNGYRWQTPTLENDNDWYLRGDADIQQLFFEGDLGEIFPGLDKSDTGAYDIGFSVGRQNLLLQNGIMLNDNVDSLGLVRNNILAGNAANLRLTGLWGWDEINRGVGPTNRERNSAHLFGLFTSIDFPDHTVEFDLAYINDDETSRYLGNRTIQYEGGDQFNVGLSFIQRIGHVNTAFRFNHSERTSGRDTIHSNSGSLFFAEASITPVGTLDHMYATMFYNNEHYTSVARDPITGGPLGQAGILFASPGIGYLRAPIENTTDHDSFGGVLGYQKFFGIRRQLIVELGGRNDTDGSDRGRLGIMARYQQAFRQHYVWRVDAYYVSRENLDEKRGIRTEFVVQF